MEQESFMKACIHIYQQQHACRSQFLLTLLNIILSFSMHTVSVPPISALWSLSHVHSTAASKIFPVKKLLLTPASCLDHSTQITSSYSQDSISQPTFFFIFFLCHIFSSLSLFSNSLAAVILVAGGTINSHKNDHIFQC